MRRWQPSSYPRYMAKVLSGLVDVSTEETVETNETLYRHQNKKLSKKGQECEEILV